MPDTWIACGPAAGPSAAGAATLGRSWLGRSRGALGWGDGVKADGDRLPRDADIVDRPVSPGRWNRGDGAAGRSFGLGCRGAKNSSSGSAGRSARAASRSLRSAASCSSRSSRRLANTPYPVIGTSKTANVAAENIASPPSWCMRIDIVPGKGGLTGRLLGCAPVIAGLALGGCWTTVSASAGTANARSGTDAKLIAAAALANRGILSGKRRGLPCEYTHSATSVLFRWGVIADGSPIRWAVIADGRPTSQDVTSAAILTRAPGGSESLSAALPLLTASEINPALSVNAISSPGAAAPNVSM